MVPLRWSRSGCLELLDQRLLPRREAWIECADAAAVEQAIRTMVVRGAPAIGIAAAYGVALAARVRRAEGGDWRAALAGDLEALADARPTAVNLGWAVRRMRAAVDGAGDDPYPAALAEAVAIHRADVVANRAMGALGAGLFETPCGGLTHCNAGAMATAGDGTALGLVRAAGARGSGRRV